MPLSLASIHNPLKDFFLSRFGGAPGGPVCFRFDKLKAGLSEGDVIDSKLPPPGYSPALALERFSQFVNMIPVQDADGLSVITTASAIDSLYGLRLLGPAAPYVPAGVDGTTSDALVASFGALKDAATKRWDQVRFESGSGIMLEYPPCPPDPIDWYVRTNTGNWTGQSFRITEGTARPLSSPSSHLWRLKIRDAEFKTMVEGAEPVGGLAPVERPVDTLPAGNSVGGRGPWSASPGTFRPVRLPRLPVDLPLPWGRPATPDDIRLAIGDLHVVDRAWWYERFLARAPTAPTTTSSISIDFEYCLIRIARPWLLDALLADRSWYIPAMAKGSLTAPDPFGGTLPLLPIGVVVVRNLMIAATWTAADVTNAAMATHFGPFTIDGAIVNNTLTHAGIQAIGWLLQWMPPLPPNDPLD